jgi:pimeloyl-ACP methyl ester carboxylesterase
LYSNYSQQLCQEWFKKEHCKMVFVQFFRMKLLVWMIGMDVISSWTPQYRPQGKIWRGQPRMATLNGVGKSIEPCHEVVLFGIGDLRTDDHGGLINALKCSSTSTTNIHCCVALTDVTLRNTCGMVAHTVDTVHMLVSAMTDLNMALEDIGLGPFHCITSPQAEGSNKSVITDFIKNLIQPADSTGKAKVRMHVCDLGPIDNEMGYGAYRQVQLEQPNWQKEDDATEWEVVPWSSALRTVPWDHVKRPDVNFPLSFPEYRDLYAATTAPPLEPVSPSPFVETKSTNGDTSDFLPTFQSLLEQVQRCILPMNHNLSDTANTGLYETHWGGLSSETMGCQSVLQCLRSYCDECNEDDMIWKQHIDNPANFKNSPLTRNARSLEHAAMIWQGQGGHFLHGEGMIRYLSAPLYFGTVSPRRVWHTAGRSQGLLQSLWTQPPLRTLVEGREWHNLLAARSFYTTPSPEETKHRNKYWRYHGFLCRYVETELAKSNNVNKEGILLVHGFGASGAQWNKLMSELSQTSALPAFQGLAPDLIGFGQSEKPALSYTSYMWDSQLMDFLKEIAVYRNKWASFVTGGNSIGGFTSMSLAACDAASGSQLSSSGSSGTGLCSGLVLMNSAGPIKTRDEVEQETYSEYNGRLLTTVAQTTATGRLQICNPPPRPVARIFGNALLSYLRPNIQPICRNLYPTNPLAVDDILVQGIERDSLDPGAINVMMAGAKLPPPRTANELLGADFGYVKTVNGDHDVSESFFDGPVLIAQGVLDPLNNATDRMNRFHSLRDGISIAPIPAGHCPHDELPGDVATSIADWMSTRTTKHSRVADDTGIMSFKTVLR